MGDTFINYITIQIINFLFKQQDWITSDVISRQLGISIRSIKSYVSQINQSTDWIISSRKGYKINPEYQNEILENFDIKNIQLYYESSKYRPNYVLKKLITSPNGYDLYDLSEELFVSLSTLKADLNKLIPLLNDHDLTLTSSNNIYVVVGKEKNKRKLISSILMKESQMGFALKDMAEDLISASELEIIQNVLINSLHTYSYYVNDYALFDLTTSLIIATYRIRHQCTLTTVSHIPSMEDSNEYFISKEIFLSLKNQLDLDFSEEEILDFSLLIRSQSLPIRYNEVNENNLLSFVSPEVLELVHDITARVNKVYYIDLNMPSFYLKFALHLQNLLIRAKIGHFSINPMTQSIKESCPFIYEISVFIANLIDEKENIVLDENEIAYIALHIGCIFNKDNPGDQLTALLVCPNYYDLTKHLYSLITERFKDLVYISSTVYNEEDLKTVAPYDFILTTLDLPVKNNVPVLKINFIPTNQDWENITTLIQNINSSKKQARIRNILSPLFNKNLFIYNADWSNRSDAIEQICKTMAAEGFVEPDYSQYVFARETISSTAFGNIAIPHSLHPRGIRTGIFISIHRKPLEWGERYVSIVLLLSIKPNDQQNFSEIFSKLTEILSSQDNVNMLSKCESFDDFLDTLSKLS